MITVAYYQDREARLVPLAARWLLFTAERSSGVSDPAVRELCASAHLSTSLVDRLRGSLVLDSPGSSHYDLCWRRGDAVRSWNGDSRPELADVGWPRVLINIHPIKCCSFIRCRCLVFQRTTGHFKCAFQLTSFAGLRATLAAHRHSWQCHLCMETLPTWSLIQASLGDTTVIWIIMIIKQ